MSPDFAIRTTADATRRAEADTLLTPRFYTTDYAAMDRIDMTPVRAEWDQLMAEFGATTTGPLRARPRVRGRSARTAARRCAQEFLDFLISRCTSEFSGCVLYTEIRKRVNNPDIAR